MSQQRFFHSGGLTFTLLLMACGGAPPAGPVTALDLGSSTLPVRASMSGGSPFESCTADQVATQPGVNFADTEVEPWLDVNPTNANIMVGTWQQDRWSSGGARSLMTATSVDGGLNWTPHPITGVFLCAGGSWARASDPWVSYGPTGILYHLSLAANSDAIHSAIIAGRSVDDGLTWTNTTVLKQDTTGNGFSDKQSVTADPTDARYAYAVWDRLLTASEHAGPGGFENATGFQGPTWFSRTTDSGLTWEAARIIFDPGRIAQTIGNQIVVLPGVNGGAPTLLNGIDLIYYVKNAKKQRGYNVAVLRSDNRGASWSAPTIISKFAPPDVLDPDRLSNGAPFPVRTGDIIPEFASDPSNANAAYAVWQDSDAAGLSVIKLARSSDRGRTWSAPVQVNQTPAGLGLNGQAFNPNVAVNSDGHGAVTYYDFRKNANDADQSDTRTDFYLAHCHPSAVNQQCAGPGGWSSETRLTPSSFNLQRAAVARGEFLGDYNGLKSSGRDFVSLFAATDSTDASPHSSIFFARFTPDTP
ncbi:glycoside hydrolase (plasmid) [Deinococcus taeanensis]|uniref:sialidase family protein n=1 Tax=Deinococcus taeanensis TaxID=2737050 RepID=UPI001CDD378C|nr:sialidase family protein [Deinococcus taeanensis]UBV45409.1 glycoside hydrolase [Deinococcus taeanensis]